ncbi:uncharacterized protein LOC106011539 [Aplysia californica]|uniref:Uncharacterized protein LOC106011539 n=1 Tax=Aplysia californica TaxID=6500 RepID=A0ABM0ZYB0_APLCA|nr:uncharacterized protein LOC106011539 [Aplysia californica]
MCNRKEEANHIRAPANKPPPPSQNTYRFLLRRSSTRRVDQDGLRNVKYHLTKTSFKPLYTWINVYVNATAVYQDAPDVIKHLTDRIVKEYKSVFGTRLQGDFIQPIV